MLKKILSLFTLTTYLTTSIALPVFAEEEANLTINHESSIDSSSSNSDLFRDAYSLPTWENGTNNGLTHSFGFTASEPSETQLDLRNSNLTFMLQDCPSYLTGTKRLAFMDFYATYLRNMLTINNGKFTLAQLRKIAAEAALQYAKTLQ